MDFMNARQSMVDGQLRPNRVNDQRLISRFLSVPREQFVQDSCRSYAYCDNPIAIAPGRELLAPQVSAHLIQALNLTEEDTVLVVASGTGYSALIMAPLVHKVYGVEDQPTLVDQARRALIDSKFSNVEFSRTDVTQGLAKKAPYSNILVDTAVAKVPEILFEQLANGGRLSAVEQGSDSLLEAVVYHKQGSKLERTTLSETKAKLHPSFPPEEGFVF
jgi:protein-L-isoaspartate(D-aspartate) O-methyltransferase